MLTKINSLAFLAILSLLCGCMSFARGITYSVLADRVEDGAVVVIVHLQLEGGVNWYGAGAKQKAMLLAERVVRLELAKKGITEYAASDASYLEIRQNIHRVGLRVREGSGRLAKSIGQTSHGTVQDDDVAPPQRPQ